MGHAVIRLLRWSIIKCEMSNGFDHNYSILAQRWASSVILNSYSTLWVYIYVLHVPAVLGLLSSAGLKPAQFPVLKGTGWFASWRRQAEVHSEPMHVSQKTDEIASHQFFGFFVALIVINSDKLYNSLKKVNILSKFH